MTTRLSVVCSLVSLAAALLPVRASAQTVVPEAADTRIVSDPLFLPLKGQVYGATIYSFNQPTGENFKAGAETSSFTAGDHLVNQTLAYGLLDRLTLRLGFGYGVNERDSTTEATGDVTVGNARGWSDPTVSATYRLLDETSAPLIVDVTGGFSPDLIDAKASGGVGTGTIGRGGRNADLGVSFGRVTRGFTLAGTTAATYVGQQTTLQLSNGTSTSADAHWSYSVGLATQTRFTARTSLGAGVTVGSAADYAVSNVDTGKTHTYGAPLTRSLNLAFNYHVVPNRFVVAVAYAYDNDTSATNTFVKATSNTAVKDRSGSTVGVRLMYLFQ
ncbi:MAG: hypothetical protein ACRD1V_12320 [Vicinamibacterales bacterium]